MKIELTKKEVKALEFMADYINAARGASNNEELNTYEKEYETIHKKAVKLLEVVK